MFGNEICGEGRGKWLSIVGTVGVRVAGKSTTNFAVSKDEGNNENECFSSLDFGEESIIIDDELFKLNLFVWNILSSFIFSDNDDDIFLENHNSEQ